MADDFPISISDHSPAMFGRRKIYTALESEEITQENVILEVNNALGLHMENVAEEDYLYWYRRSLQPILFRKKEIRPEINNKIVVNNADMVVTFKNGYFLTNPASYVSRKDDDEISDKIKTLNEYLYVSGKPAADNVAVDWFHTVGVGVILCEPTKDPEEAQYKPASVYALDPRSAFVVYSLRPGNKPVFGVNIVVSGANIYIDVFTNRFVFKLLGTVNPLKETVYPDVMTAAYTVVSVEPNVVGRVPIIEYQYKSNRMSAFENALYLMDAINIAESNRLDAIEQTVQNLMVLYNCELPEGESANSIRENGLIVLKSTSDNRADVKLMSESLDQQQTQITLDDLYEQMLEKCGVPSSVRDGGSTSDNVGAVYLRSGWAMADTDARNTEDQYRASNKLFDEVFLRILARKGVLTGVVPSDFDVAFARGNMNNILVKTQAALNLKQLGFSPELAFEKSGLSNDPVSDVEASGKYIDIAWGGNAPNSTDKVGFGNGNNFGDGMDGTEKGAVNNNGGNETNVDAV